jgi:hypothetical protein
MQSLPYSLGSAEQDVSLPLAPGSHPLELLGNGGEEVAEPEVLAVVAAG